MLRKNLFNATIAFSILLVLPQGSLAKNTDLPLAETIVLSSQNKPRNIEIPVNPGCNIACYSHDQSGAINNVGGNIYVHGQVRVAGNYIAGMCKPTGYENSDISKVEKMKKACNVISSCANNQCWAGGDTGFISFLQKKNHFQNEYTDNPGCYIACYSHDRSSGLYPVGGNVYVNGQVRVAGRYIDGICQPLGFENKDISNDEKMKEACNKISSCEKNKCWAGGDTLGVHHYSDTIFTVFLRKFGQFFYE